MTDKENQPTGLHRDLFLAISRDISLTIELELGNKYKKTTNCDNVEHNLLGKINVYQNINNLIFNLVWNRNYHHI